MTFTLIIFIDLALIVAIYATYRKRRTVILPLRERYRIDEHTKGQVAKALARANMAEKFAERAFNLASSANVGIIALQKTLPNFARQPSVTQQKKNLLAKKEVDGIFNGANSFDWLWPILDDDEREIVHKAQEYEAKQRTPVTK